MTIRGMDTVFTQVRSTGPVEHRSERIKSKKYLKLCEERPVCKQRNNMPSRPSQHERQILTTMICSLSGILKTFCQYFSSVDAALGWCMAVPKQTATLLCIVANSTLMSDGTGFYFFCGQTAVQYDNANSRPRNKYRICQAREKSSALCRTYTR